MLEYILRLLILLPIVGGLAFGSLWLWKKVQMGQLGLPLAAQRQNRAVQMISLLPIGAGSKLAVVEFGGQQILLAITRNGITRLADDAEAQSQNPSYQERNYSPHGDGDFHVG